jgi:hypothetical protein
MPDEPKTTDTGGGAYFGGNVTAGGDVIGRDQTITNVGNQQGVSIEEFRSLLAEFRHLLSEATLDADTTQVIEADFQVLENQAAKEKPNGAIVKSKLKGMTELLGDTASAAGSLDKIIGVLGKLTAYAGVLLP